MSTLYDICGIGNAIVDVVATTEPEFLARNGMTAGAMQLIDADEAERLYGLMPPGIESSGGSAANTCAVAAGLGVRACYLGKVARDQLGEVFAHDITAAGVHFPSVPAESGPPTARCLILVTPDGQRTMNTYLGASTAFEPGDVDAGLIALSSIVYLEGYLFDRPAAQSAFYQAAAAARAAGRRVAVSLSDAFCVDRHRDAFLLLLQTVDLLFANEAELCSLYQVDFAASLKAARTGVKLAAVTRGEQGSVILRGSETVEVPASPALVVDTTGAGDAYAAGFMAALVRGESLAACGALGSQIAAKVIEKYGARL